MTYLVFGTLTYKNGSGSANHKFTDSTASDVHRKIGLYKFNSHSMVVEASDPRKPEIYIKLENRKFTVWFYAFPIENDTPRITIEDLKKAIGFS